MAYTPDEEFSNYVAGGRRQLYGFAFLLSRDPHAAEDLVQTALAKLYVAWPRIRHAGREDAYARKIVVRSFLDERRRPWRRELAVDEVPELEIASGISYEDVDALRAAVRSLPRRQRASIVLRYWWGLSIEEAAADLGVSPATVKSNTARAINRLRQRLEDRRAEVMR